jgi:20S proteasome subunit beta 2
VCVITAEGTEMLRNHIMPNEREAKERKYIFRRGTTAFTKESVRKFVITDELVVPTGAAGVGATEAMDTT